MGYRSCLVIQRLLRGTRHGTSPHGCKGDDAPHRPLRPRAPMHRTEHLLATALDYQTGPSVAPMMTTTNQVMMTTLQATQEPTGGVAGWAIDLMERMGPAGAGLAVALESLF